MSIEVKRAGTPGIKKQENRLTTPISVTVTTTLVEAEEVGRTIVSETPITYTVSGAFVPPKVFQTINAPQASQIKSHRTVETRTTINRISSELSQKALSGVNSWDELLTLIEKYPTLFERVYIDLDDTLFSPAYYTGSDTWLRNERALHGKSVYSVRNQKNLEEDRLLRSTSPSFKTCEEKIAERIKNIQAANPHIEIIGLTARDISRSGATAQILNSLKVNIPVIYATFQGVKRKIFEGEFLRRNNEVKEENNRRLEETRARLKAEHKKDPDDEEVYEQTTFVQKGFWVFIDDRMQALFGKRKPRELSSQNGYCLQYNHADDFSFETSLGEFQNSLSIKDTEKAINYLIDALILLKGNEAEPQIRRDIYSNKTILDFIRDSKNPRLTMAFIDSVSDFIVRGSSVDDVTLELYFEILTPHNKDSFIDAFKSGKLEIQENIHQRSYIHPESNYLIVIDEKNCYLFLEPLLKYIKAEKPDVVILPDSGARPFKPLIEHFLKEEGLDSEVILFPICKNRASDTPYELKRWMKLLKGELEPQTKEDAELILSLQALNLDVFKGASKAVILDDNIITGSTIKMLTEVIESEYSAKVTACLTPFALLHEGTQNLPIVSTLNAVGNYSWRQTPCEIFVPTAWEYDNGNIRGVKTRKRFQAPPCEEKTSVQGEKLRQRLKEGFIASYIAAKQNLFQPQVPNLQRLPKPEISVSIPSTVNTESFLLPDYFDINSSLMLQRSSSLSWLLEEKGLNQDDVKYLSHKDVAYYEIVDLEDRVIGGIVLVQGKDGNGNDCLLIQKIQPKMEHEHLLDPVLIAGGLRDYLRDRKNINGLYIDSDKETMTGLSESHRVRRDINEKYSFLTRSDENPFSAHKNGWIRGGNILWKRLNDEDYKTNISSLELLSEIFGNRLPNEIEKVVSGETRHKPYQELEKLLNNNERKRLLEIVRVLEINDVPISESDISLLRQIKYLNDELPLYTRGKDTLEKIRTRCYFRTAHEEGIQTGEDIQFPEDYFRVANPRVRRERIDEAIKYFFLNIWDQGCDLSNISAKIFKNLLAQAGLLGIYTQFRNHGEFLKFLSPGCYSYKPGSGYVSNEGVEISLKSLKEYLRGKWYRAAPGAVFLPNNITTVPKSIRGKKVIFEENPNIGLLARLESSKGDGRARIIYLDNGKPILSYKDSVGSIEVSTWMRGDEITPRDNNESFIFERINTAGRILVKQDPALPNRGNLTVGYQYASKDNQDNYAKIILRRDINHGVIAYAYLCDSDGNILEDKPINIFYFDNQSNLTPINHGISENKTIRYLDFEKWMRGDDIIPRDNDESFVFRRIDIRGRIHVKQDPALPHRGKLTIGKQHASKNDQDNYAKIILRRDINHGVITVSYLCDLKGNITSDKPVNISFFDDNGTLTPLNQSNSENRTIGYLDFVKWMSGEEVIPRESDESFVFKRMNDEGKIYVKQDPSLPNQGGLRIGRKYASKDGVDNHAKAILKNIPGIGTVALCYLYDPETKQTISGVVKAVLIKDGKQVDVTDEVLNFVKR